MTPNNPAATVHHHALDLIQLHAQAVNGLHAALRLLTSSDTPNDAQAFTQALSRALRATSALKMACTAARELAA